MARDERREVTVLFADVIGFTAMCERLDPEAVHSVMNECFEGLGSAIKEEGGYIDKYIGDNVMALFGAPVAHEDDPVRACRAALAMQAFLAGFSERCRPKTGAALQMRIGINSGLVVAGSVGSELRKDYSVMGDTVNLAARLETAAPPGCVLVSREVVRRTAGKFEFGVARRLTVKGKQQPVEAYELLRESAEAERRGLERSSVPFVGRETELRELVTRWEPAAGRHRWIEIRGEMGLGKTKLVQEAERRISGRRLLAVDVTSDTAHRPFGVVRLLVYAVLREMSGRTARPETREAFAETLALLADDLAPFVDALWHLVAPSRLAVPAPDPDPQSLRRTLEHGVVRLILRLAKRAPNLALFLDSYGLADEASANLFESLGGRSEGWPLPIIAASRYGGRASLNPDAVIRLHPLSDDETGELLNNLIEDAEFPQALRRELIKRASGVPQYLEEMVGTLADEGVLTRTAKGSYRMASETPVSVSLPSSIRAAMVARLDHLERETRDLLCRCSVQGVEFVLDVVEGVRRNLSGERPPTRTLLPELERRGLVMSLDEAGTRWAFRQPLMQETCYETLMLRDRRILHAKTAQALAELAGGFQAVSPELLAHHYERAEHWAAAAEANQRAGDRAGELYLNAEAIQRYERALEAVNRVKTPSAKEIQIAACAHAGAARMHLRVGAYPFAIEHAKKMRTRAAQSEDRSEADRLIALACIHTGRTDEAERLLLGVLAEPRDGPTASGVNVSVHVLYDLAELCHRAGRTDEALERLRQCRSVAGSHESLVTIQADMLEGRILHAAGRFADASRLYARAYEGTERVGSLSERARASNSLGNAARDQGKYALARDHFTKALEYWERTGDVECIAGARNNLGNLAMSQGDFEAAREHHRQSLAVCSEIRNVQGAALAQANLAILAIEEGDGRGAVAAAKEAIVTLGDSGNVLLRGLVSVVLGEGHLECGEAPAAQTILNQVLNDFDESLHPLAVAGALRGLGRVALLQGSYSQALTLLDHAIEIYERIERAQEAARAGLYRAEALWRSGEKERGRSELDRARKRFGLIHANRDVERAERLLREMLRVSPG
ncbi:MAG: tetratricopeptide repeat protein [Nitrospirae bacterium]|nr:tetratricopeptide repeat protein [Nitrospirota bacterium]